MSMLKTYIYSDFFLNSRTKWVKHKLKTFSQIYICFVKSIQKKKKKKKKSKKKITWDLGPAGRSGAPGVRKPLVVHQDPIHPHLSR